MIFKKIIDYVAKARLLKRLKKVGENFILAPGGKIIAPEFVEIGDQVFIGELAYISAEVSIGNRVMFGPRPVIIGGDHYFGVKGRHNRFLRPQARENVKKIVIGDDCWFGANVTILKGVNVGTGTVVGAGSVVCNSLPPYTVCVGNPCRPIKRIFSDEVLSEHLISLGYAEESARETLNKRKTLLLKSGNQDLPVIDNTDDYWETKS